MTKKLFYAVNPTGQGNVFSSMPVRSPERNCWVGHIEPCYAMALLSMECEGFRFPDIKWRDDPVTVTLSANF